MREYTVGGCGEMVDTLDLGSSDVSRVGSNPIIRTLRFYEFTTTKNQ